MEANQITKKQLEVRFRHNPAISDVSLLGDLKRKPPRLILDRTEQERLKKAVEKNRELESWYKVICRDAERCLEQPPAAFAIPDGKRLLQVSRLVKERIQNLFLSYLVEDDLRFVARIWNELENAAGFESWNPSHFLDTAEMTFAFAAAYDWLYDQWTESQKVKIRDAIVKLGLKPAMEVYQSDSGFHRKTNNWNQVCNGGIGLGALAIADEEPELATSILRETLSWLPGSIQLYGPDGASGEGATYWDYGTRYLVLYLCGLHTALGKDFGLSEIEGFGESGYYPLYMSGAKGIAFNFGDCGLCRVSTAQHFWLGKRFGRPEYGAYRLDELRHGECPATLWDLLWYDENADYETISQLPLSKHFRVAECASMRSAWHDTDALVLGFQAGDNNNLMAHRHLDLGSFILEAGGERWAIDPGKEKLTYQTHRHPHAKWEFYRIRAEGHNTLVINPGFGPDQIVDAVTRIVNFEYDSNKTVSTADLTDAYETHARLVERRIEMVDGARVIVTDEIDCRERADVWWFMHTCAAIELNRNHTVAKLSQNDRTLFARIAEPEEASFSIMDALPLSTSPNPPDQEDNHGLRKLAIHLIGEESLRIIVEFGSDIEEF